MTDLHRPHSDHLRREVRLGAFCGLTAYTWWGLLTALYMKSALDRVPVMELVAHRLVWSVVLLIGLVLARRSWGELRGLIARRGTLLLLVATSLLIALNWTLFAVAIANKQLIQASLGYFINPLLSVLLGFVFLRERLRPMQLFSVLLAAAAVTYLTVAKGAIPGMALGMAGSFALYGLLRKVARVEAITGLWIETMLLLPAALAYLGLLAGQGDGSFISRGWGTSALLMLAGPVTAIPLVLFVAAARRLRLSTVGFIQYLAPTGQFLLAVGAYGEPFDRQMGHAFAGIWIALALYSLDAVRAQRSGA